MVRWSELSEADRKTMTEVYEERVFPVLTPLAVDPSHPFPYISDLALSVAAFVGDPDSGEPRFARVKVPALSPASFRSTSVATCPPRNSSSPISTAYSPGW